MPEYEIAPADDLAARGPGSRRGFLRRSAVAATAGAAALGAAASTASAGVKPRRTTSTTPSPNDYPFPDPYAGWFSLRMQEIKNDENGHLNQLLGTLGVFARPQPIFQNVTPTSAIETIQLGAQFCNTGAGAYLGAGPYVQNPSIAMTGASFGQVEAFQSGWLNSVLNLPLVVGASAASPPLTPEVVMTRVAPYLVSLNGGPPLTYSTLPSYENDIAILNFALFLEYLENALYNYGVPKFFS